MIEKNKLGMACFLFGEANFFLSLILSYVYYRVGPSTGPTAATSLDLHSTAIYTACLVASSGTVWLAERSERHGRRGAVSAWLATTVALGIVFLVGQGREYARLITAQVTIARNVFGSSFFTLTGLHGLHVLLGVLSLSVLLGLALGDRLGARPSPSVDTVALYWHFVDGVWIVIFGVVYVAAFV